jgi:radical SAM protein with 4Fe4S-binding SPASM domain
MGWTSHTQAALKIPEILCANRLSFDFDCMPMRIENLSAAQKWNLLACGLQGAAHSIRAWGLPPVVQIEPANICNLHCPLCAVGAGTMKRKQGLMRLDTFQRLLAELGPTTICAVLYGWGEPLLNADFARMVSACRKYNMATITSTNGNALRSYDHALEIVDSGLTHLVIAIDGSRQDVYEAYRRDGNLAAVLRCAELIEKAKASRQSRYPYTNLRLVVMETNLGDLANVERLAAEQGVNMFSRKSVGCLAQPAVGSSLSVSCPYPWRQPTVFWDGTVVACEFDFDADMALGNIHEQSFANIWNGREISAQRRMFRGQKERPTYCKRCPYPNRQPRGTMLGYKELRPLS